MKKALLLLALVQGITLSAFAQTAAPADAPKTRADVKNEAKAAAMSGDTKSSEVAPTTPASGPVAANGKKTRAEVKAEAKAANKAGELTKGDIGTQETPVVRKARAKKPATPATPAAPEAAK